MKNVLRLKKCKPFCVLDNGMDSLGLIKNISVNQSEMTAKHLKILKTFYWSKQMKLNIYIEREKC